jgi:hypothetical protein
MSDLLSQMTGGQLIAVIAISGAMLVAAISVLSGAWVSVRQTECRTRRFELETALKKDMLDRGMSLDEIERMFAAGTAAKPKCSSGSKAAV